MIGRIIPRSLLVSAICMLLVLTACSSGTRSKASPGAKGSGPELAFGLIGSFSGALGSPGIPIAAKVWASSVNAAGGLNGSRVRIVKKDVSTTTGAGLTAAKQLIEQDHVVAIFDTDSNDNTWLPYTATTNVPVVGFTSIGSSTSPNAFPVSVTPLALAYALPALGKTVGSKFGVLYCAEAPSCGGLAALISKNASTAGVSVPVSLKISSSAPDYTAACQSLKAGGVDSYLVIAGTPLVKKIADQCYQEGLRAKLVQNGAQVSASWKTDPAFNGAIISDNTAPYFLNNTPAHQAYRTALSKYAPSYVGGDLDNGLMELPWLQGELISAAASHVTGTLTGKSLKRGLYALRAETLGGMIQPVTFRAGKPTLLACYFSWGIDNGEYTAPNGDHYSCAPSSALGG